MIHGRFDIQKAGHPESYYAERGITLDFRGPLEISGATMWGFGYKVYTQAHNPANWAEVTIRPVRVEHDAWIASEAILYNCTVGRGAVVGLGTVVASRDVPPYTMVEGNPARIVARLDWETKKWVYLDKPEELPRKGQKK